MRYCAQKHLLAQIWQFLSRNDLEYLVVVTKTKSALHHIPMLYSCKSGWNLPPSSWDMVHTSTFWLKFGSLSPAVTLKIRSRSPKPNQLFITSQCYIQANLVKIHTPVHIVQTRKCHTDANTNADRIHTKKQSVPLPFGGGHNPAVCKYKTALTNRIEPA